MKTKLLAISYFLFLAVVVYYADTRAHLHLFSFVRSLPGGDKCGHFLLMGGLAFLLNLSLSCRVVRIAGRGLLIGSIVALTVITIEEFSQLFVPYRTFDLLDLIADYSGVVVFSWLAVVIARNRKARAELVATDSRGQELIRLKNEFCIYPRDPCSSVAGAEFLKVASTSAPRKSQSHPRDSAV